MLFAICIVFPTHIHYGIVQIGISDSVQANSSSPSRLWSCFLLRDDFTRKLPDEPEKARANAAEREEKKERQEKSRISAARSTECTEYREKLIIQSTTPVIPTRFILRYSRFALRGSTRSLPSGTNE